MKYKLIQKCKDRTTGNLCYLIVDSYGIIGAYDSATYKYIDTNINEHTLDKSDENTLLNKYESKLSEILKHNVNRLKYTKSVLEFAIFYMGFDIGSKESFDSFIERLEKQLDDMCSLTNKEVTNKVNKKDLKYSYKTIVEVFDPNTNMKISIKKGDIIEIKTIKNTFRGKVTDTDFGRITLNKNKHILLCKDIISIMKCKEV